MTEHLHKLGLGTVQFGVDYGISNSQGQTPLEEVRAILSEAAASGIRVVDTAALYGTSEEALGRAVSPGHSFSIVTKTCKFTGDDIPREAVANLRQTFERSRARLNQKHVFGLLFHDTNDLLKRGGARLWEEMFSLKHEGLVDKIGVSVYTAEQIEQVLGAYDIDLIQLPFNVLDQRLAQGGWLKKLKERGVEVHARSSFLQGLLLMKPEELPDYFRSIHTLLEQYHRLLTDRGVSPLKAALDFVAGQAEIDAVICGVNNREQLRDIVAALTESSANLDLTQFAIQDQAMLDPSQWKLK